MEFILTFVLTLPLFYILIMRPGMRNRWGTGIDGLTNRERRDAMNERNELIRADIKDQNEINKLEQEKMFKEYKLRTNRRANGEYGEYGRAMYAMIEDESEPFDENNPFGSVTQSIIRTIPINEHKVRKEMLDMGFVNAELEYPNHDTDYRYKCESLPFQIERKMLEYQRKQKGEKGENFRVHLN